MVNIILNGKKSLIEELEKRGSNQRIRVDGEAVNLELLQEPTRAQPDLVVRINGRVLLASFGDLGDASAHAVRLNGHLLSASLELDSPTALTNAAVGLVEGPVIISSPMSGRIVALKVSLGVAVDAGQSVVVLEAMKMENEIASPKKGIVSALHVTLGSLVKAGDQIAIVE